MNRKQQQQQKEMLSAAVDHANKKIAMESTAKGHRDYKSTSHVSEVAAYDTGGEHHPGQAIALDENLMAESTADRILRGIKFRANGGRDLVLHAINVEVASLSERIYKEQYAFREETEQRLYASIGKLEEALRLEQFRHFEDIQKFASSGRYETASLRRY